MKQIMKIKGIARKLGYGICLALLLAHFSCDSIHETLPECRLYVDFRYDYNMEFANVFAGRVDRIDVFIFDKDGKFIMQKTGQGERLAAGNYRMLLDLPLGEYRISAWGGMSDDFEMPRLVVGQSTPEDLTVKMKREATLIQGTAPSLVRRTDNGELYRTPGTNGDRPPGEKHKQVPIHPAKAGGRHGARS